MNVEQIFDSWIEHSRRIPYAHQIVGVQRLTQFVEPEIGRIYPGCFFLADDMRLGKTKQIIDAAQLLYMRGEINRVVVVCPSPVRSVWYDQELGELAKHLWHSVPSMIADYHGKGRAWMWGAANKEPRLDWFITNYEYIGHGVKRIGDRWSGWNLDPLVDLCSQQTMLVLDETAWVKSARAGRTRACVELRRHCGRVVLLNGTPIAQAPGDLFSQAFIMDPRILNCETSAEFKARYAYTEINKTRSGRRFESILGWHNIEDLQKALAPYVLRRIRSECLDLPPKLDPVTLTATLKPETWKVYKQMREQLMVYLTESTMVTAPQAGVKVMRLAQITDGFLGGMKKEVECYNCPGEMCDKCGGSGLYEVDAEPVEVGREKLDLMVDWVRQRYEEDPQFRMVVWCRFRPELFRLVKELRIQFPYIRTLTIHGGQDPRGEERTQALRLMHPDTPKYNGAAILVGTQGTGSVGLNMAGAHEVVYFSNGYSLFQRKQSEDRPHGPGQTQPVSYHDIVAEGPKGQTTIDHEIVHALQSREDLANRTVSAWVTALKKEELE